MKWWPPRRRDPGQIPAADLPAASEALRKVRQDKADVEANWPNVWWLTHELEVHRQANHFAEMMTRAMKRRDER